MEKREKWKIGRIFTLLEFIIFGKIRKTTSLSESKRSKVGIGCV